MELMSIFSFPFLLDGCFAPNKRVPTIYEDGFFKYIYRGENSIYQDINDKAIVIIGFTDLGLEQEAIDIPREINGEPVEQIGIWDQSHSHDDTRYLESKGNVEKIYVFDNIKTFYFSGFESDVFLCSSTYSLLEQGIGCKNLFLYWDLFFEEYETIVDDFYIKPANISFFNYYSDEDYELYRIDNVIFGEKIVEPIAPKKEGFLFKGWYLEKECINRFDFNQIPDIKQNSEFILYSGWDKE